MSKNNIENYTNRNPEPGTINITSDKENEPFIEELRKERRKKEEKILKNQKKECNKLNPNSDNPYKELNKPIPGENYLGKKQEKNRKHNKLNPNLKNSNPGKGRHNENNIQNPVETTASDLTTKPESISDIFDEAFLKQFTGKAIYSKDGKEYAIIKNIEHDKQNNHFILTLEKGKITYSVLGFQKVIEDNRIKEKPKQLDKKVSTKETEDTNNYPIEVENKTKENLNIKDPKIKDLINRYNRIAKIQKIIYRDNNNSSELEVESENATRLIEEQKKSLFILYERLIAIKQISGFNKNEKEILEKIKTSLDSGDFSDKILKIDNLKEIEEIEIDNKTENNFTEETKIIETEKSYARSLLKNLDKNTLLKISEEDTTATYLIKKIPEKGNVRLKGDNSTATIAPEFLVKVNSTLFKKEDIKKLKAFPKKETEEIKIEIKEEQEVKKMTYSELNNEISTVNEYLKELKKENETGYINDSEFLKYSEYLGLLVNTKKEINKETESTKTEKAEVPESYIEIIKSFEETERKIQERKAALSPEDKELAVKFGLGEELTEEGVEGAMRAIRAEKLGEVTAIDTAHARMTALIYGGDHNRAIKELKELKIKMDIQVATAQKRLLEAETNLKIQELRGEKKVAVDRFAKAIKEKIKGKETPKKPNIFTRLFRKIRPEKNIKGETVENQSQGSETREVLEKELNKKIKNANSENIKGIFNSLLNHFSVLDNEANRNAFKENVLDNFESGNYKKIKEYCEKEIKEIRDGEEKDILVEFFKKIISIADEEDNKNEKN